MSTSTLPDSLSPPSRGTDTAGDGRPVREIRRRALLDHLTKVGAGALAAVMVGGGTIEVLDLPSQAVARLEGAQPGAGGDR